MALITCKNLSLGYEGHAILKDINFKLDGGEYLCIIGENGAGKSTLVKGLLRLKKPMGGSIIPGDNLKHKRNRISSSTDNDSERFSGKCI